MNRLRRLWNESTNLRVYALLALFLLALLPRLFSLDAFITWDEPMWTYRSIRFLAALQRMDFGGTFVVGHPGVITVWSGATGISIQRLLGSGSAADFAWLSGLPTLDPRDTEALHKLAPFLAAAKLPIAVLHAACIVGIYLLARRLFDAKAALLAALLLAFDPFHLALSRVLHIDALAADFMTLSLLSLLVHLAKRWSPELVRGRPATVSCSNPQAPNKLGIPTRSRLYLLLSGAFAALAILSKSYALFLAPFAALLIAVAYLTRERNLRQAIPSLLVSFAPWCLAAALVFFLLWPAAWVDPLGTVQGMLDTAFGYAATPEATSEFFLGKHVADAGPWFYPVVVAFRTTPLVVLGLGAAIPLLCVKREPRGELAGLLAYAALFSILMTLGAKKFDRYMLPVILALDVVAAWGLVKLGNKLKAQSLKLKLPIWILSFGFWILLLFQTGHILSYHPYYLAYYNPLLGGTATAVQALPVGWGEGMDLAARYLNQKEDATSLRVATGGIPGFAPLFRGQTEGLMEHNLATADYAVLYVSDVQQQNSPEVAALYRQQQPEHVVKIHNVDYAWIYPNTRYQELTAYLESQAQPDDIILLNANSPFVKHYQGSLAYYVILNRQNWAEMAERLAESAAPRRLWYVAYPGSDIGNWISFQLNTHALLIGQEALPHATVYNYWLTSPVALESSPTKVESDVNFGNLLRLTGYEFTDEIVEYRKQLGIILHWQTIAEMQGGYALSLRLVDERGHVWGQTDEWLEDRAPLPAYASKVGESTDRHYALSVVAGTPPGCYQVKMVVYHTDTLQSLTILDEGGAPAGTEYLLGTVSVVSSSVPPTIEELAITHPLHHDFDGQVELLGYDLSSTEVQAGRTARVILFWRALRSIQDDYRIHLQAQDHEGHIWAEEEYPLANEEYPTSRWKEGEVIQGQYDLVIDAAAPTGEQALNFKLQTSNVQVLTILSVVAPERSFTVPADIQHPLRANLADKVAFLGYDLDTVTVKPGGSLHLVLYWQALARMETSYTVFVHLLDAKDHTWGQKDSVPMKGTHPTTSWLPGEVVIDEYEIAVDAAAPAGEYQIEVGMYDLKTMLRLSAFDEQGEPLPGDRILLGKVRVRPS